jgi:23S rRNA pseudouridine955/2504/2580 synthase
LIKVHLITGKTHQIRAHLSYIGHPLVGDVKYGDSSVNKHYRESFGVTRQMLHAYELDIPYDFEIESIKGKKFIIDMPKDMQRVSDSIS